MEGLSVNECMNDIYYINDMFVTKEDARIHKDTLKNIILQEKFNNDTKLMDSLMRFETAYNYSAKEKFGDTYIALLFDRLEAISQTTSMNQGSVWTFTDIFLNMC
jgi:superoxide dismutase